MTFLQCFTCLPSTETHFASCLISPRAHFCSLLAVFCHCFFSQWSPETIARPQPIMSAQLNTLPQSCFCLQTGRCRHAELNVTVVSHVVQITVRSQAEPSSIQKVRVLHIALHTQLLCCCLIEFLTPVIALRSLLQEAQLHGDVERMRDVPIAHRGDEKDS